jgi:hypothetical protein
MHKRNFLKSAAGGCLLAASPGWTFSPAKAAAPVTDKVFSRVRPGDPGWPSEAKWNGLSKAVRGHLVKLSSPLDVCRATPDADAYKTLFTVLRNPYFISDDVRDQTWHREFTCNSSPP